MRGSRTRFPGRRFCRGPESLGVHAAAPYDQVAQSPAQQLLLERLGGAQRAHGRAVKPADEGVSHTQRYAHALVHILRELGVQGGGEGNSPTADHTPGVQAERPFRCDVDGIRALAAQDVFQLPGIAHDADLRIARQRHGLEFARMHHQRLEPEFGKMARDLLQCGDYAVCLRLPGVGHQQEFSHLRRAPGSSVRLAGIDGRRAAPR